MQHDVIEDVLKAAGKREQPPSEVERAVLENLRREWLAAVAGERRRRRRAGAALAAGIVTAALAVWVALPRLGGQGEPIASVAAISGGLSAQSGWLDRADTVQVGSSLSAGQTITSSATGRAALTLPGGLSVRLDHGTRIRLESSDRIAIERGALYIDAGATPATRRALDLETPAGIVTHIGTQYEVRLTNGGLRLRVREGRIEWRSGAGRVESGQSGELLEIGDDGQVRRNTIPTFGKSWEWVAAAAPALDIDGLPLRDFLAWAGRELGCEVEFTTPALSAEAARIVLRGAIAGLTPREALAAVLGTTSLTATVANGRIVVAASHAANAALDTDSAS